MEEVLQLIESYGLNVVLLLGCFYALYNFFFFSIREVKDTFSKHHERNADNMEELKEKINTILTILKNK